MLCSWSFIPVCLLTDQHVGRYGKPRSRGLIRSNVYKAQFRAAAISLSVDTHFIWAVGNAWLPLSSLLEPENTLASGAGNPGMGRKVPMVLSHKGMPSREEGHSSDLCFGDKLAWGAPGPQTITCSRFRTDRWNRRDPIVFEFQRNHTYFV